MRLVLNGGDEGERPAVHVDGDLPAFAVHDGAGAVVVVLHHAVEGYIGQCRPGQCGLRGTHLSPAAVHQEQVRLLAEVVAARLAICGHFGILFVFSRTAGDGLRQRGVVIGAGDRLHLELPVARLVGLAVPERHHAADAGAVAPVGNIVALDGAGGLGQAQHLRQLIQKLFLPGIAAALAGQPLDGVGVGHLDEVRLIAPLRDIELHLAAPLLVEGLLQSVHIRRQLIHGNDFRYLLIVEVVPGQKFLPHRRDVGGIVEQKLPLVGQPPLPEAEDSRADAAGRTRQRYHVHLHVGVNHHLLPCRHLGNGGDLVADEGRCLKFQPVRGFQHPLVEGFQNILFAVADEVDSAFDSLIVVFTAYLAAAHRHALADVGVQAGAAPANFLREPPAAPGQQKSIHRRLGHLTGRKARGIRADILRAVILFLQRERQPRPLVLCHLDIAVAFIVLEQDVVLRGVGFYLACFQHQRLELALADDDVERVGVGDHLADLVVVRHTLPEILAHPDAQTLGLADIDDGAAFVPDDIDARQKRQHTGLFVKFCLGHQVLCRPFCIISVLAIFDAASARPHTSRATLHHLGFCSEVSRRVILTMSVTR